MNDVEKYVTLSNISRFLDQLEHEPDGPMRSVLKNLLLAELDRFAISSERLEVAETAFIACADRVREQRGRIANMGGDDPQMALAERLLANMLDVLMIIQSTRDRLKEAFG